MNSWIFQPFVSQFKPRFRREIQAKVGFALFCEMITNHNQLFSKLIKECPDHNRLTDLM